MTLKNWKLVWRILFVLYIAAVAYICFSPPDGLPKMSFSFLGLDFDKMVHFLMFAPFPLLAYMSAGFPLRKTWRSFHLMLIVFATACLCAAGTELVQSYTPNRQPELGDFIADSLGAAITSVLTYLALPLFGRLQIH